jgi:MGT family glycosyltransferase
MGTVYIRKRIINQVIKASAGASWQLVISTGKAFSPEAWTDIPDNVLITEYVPQVALMEKVSAVVSSGGFGTVGQALMNGVPLVVIPQILEHRVTASKVVHGKAGIKLSSWLVSARRLRKAITALLQQPSYRQHALAVRADYLECDAPVSGARLLECLSEKRQVLHRPAHQAPTLYRSKVQEVLNSI